MKRYAIFLLCAAMTAAAVPASAQAIPPGQSCGGLLCDIGVFGHKVAPGPNGEPPTQAQVAAAEVADPHRLPCHDFLCRAMGQKEDVAPPPAPAVEPVAAIETPTKHARKAKRKHVAKADAAATEQAPTAAK